MKQQLNITMGTDVVLHDRLIFEGETFDPNLSVGIAANLVSSLGKRTALDVQVVDDELLISVPWIDGTLPGCYGLEVTGSCNSKKWATYADSLIKYTKATRLGVSEVTVESDSYDITQEIGYRYGEGGNINDVKVNGVSVVSAGKANITIPTNVSAFENDTNYQTAKQVSKSIQDNLISGAEVSVDDNIGTPYATVTKNGSKLYFAFRNLKGGKGDKGDDGGVGPVGPQGATGVYDSTTQDFLVTLETTTGQSQTKTMTQKAITDELYDKTFLYDEMSLSGYTVYNWFIRATSDIWKASSNTGNQCVLIPVKPGDVIKAVGSDNGQGGVWTPQVVFLTTDEHSDGDPAPYAGGEETYPAWPSGTIKTVPEDAAYMYVRLKTDYTNVTPTLYKVSSLKEDYTATRANVLDIEHGVKKNTIVPSYFFGSIISSGYQPSQYGNKITRELEFDPDVISSITIHRRGSEVLYALYTITGDVITTPTGYVTGDYTFTPISGVKYVIRIAPSASGTATRAKMEAVPVSSYPALVINYANTSDCIGNIEGQLRQIGEKYYGYSRNYSNITPLLTFEHKSISNEGIVDSQSSLLAKIPSIGCVEVKMNRPAGHFSVWKVTGSTITCLQESSHYQYRYTGDYSSDYYVMLQAETGETLNTAISLVYTYSDEGKTFSYIPPSWAAGKKIAFYGDSIVQGRYPKNGSSSVNICMDKPWPNLVAEALGTEDFMNFAIGGALVYNNDWRSLQRNADLIVGYDIVFICGGTNDYGNKTSKANFEAAYSDMLDSLIANNTKVIVMTPVRRTKTASSPVMPLVDYAVSIMDVAASKNIPVVDTIKLTDTPEFDQHLVDGLHPDEIGQRMIADALLEAIKYID